MYLVLINQVRCIRFTFVTKFNTSANPPSIEHIYFHNRYYQDKVYIASMTPVQVLFLRVYLLIDACSGVMPCPCVTSET